MSDSIPEIEGNPYLAESIAMAGVEAMMRRMSCDAGGAWRNGSAVYCGDHVRNVCEYIKKHLKDKCERWTKRIIEAAKAMADMLPCEKENHIVTTVDTNRLPDERVREIVGCDSNVFVGRRIGHPMLPMFPENFIAYGRWVLNETGILFQPESRRWDMSFGIVLCPECGKDTAGRKNCAWCGRWGRSYFQRWGYDSMCDVCGKTNDGGIGVHGPIEKSRPVFHGGGKFCGDVESNNGIAYWTESFMLNGSLPDTWRDGGDGMVRFTDHDKVICKGCFIDYAKTSYGRSRCKRCGRFFESINRQQYCSDVCRQLREQPVPAFNLDVEEFTDGCKKVQG